MLYLLNLVENQTILDHHWLAGFTSGKGCFFVNINKLKTGNFVAKLVFQLTQYSGVELLLKSFIEYFSAGNYFTKSNKPVGDFIVTKFSDIIEKIIPFFKKYPIEGTKASDYAKF